MASSNFPAAIISLARRESEASSSCCATAATAKTTSSKKDRLSLKDHAETESQLSLTGSTCNLHKAAGRDTGATHSTEVRRIRKIKSFGAESQIQSFTKAHLARDVEIRIKHTRVAQDIATAGAESVGSRHRRESSGIVVELAGPVIAELGDRALHLVCRLCIIRGVQRRARGGYGKRRTCVRGQDAVHLPVAQHRGSYTGGRQALAFAKGQFVHPSDLEHMLAVETGGGA